MNKKYFLWAAMGLAVACQNAETPAGDDSADTDLEQDTSMLEQEEEQQPSLEMVWETDTVLTTNESVLYNADENMLYVSNIDGKPTEKDGKGFISKMSPDGEIQNLKWVTGLDAPKGMGIHNGTLYVTNIDELVEINLETGKTAKRYPVQGAKFLNDVVPAGDAIYFSDMNTGKLHKLQNGKVSTVKDGLKGINGVDYSESEDALYMLTAAGLQRMGANDSLETVNSTVTGGDGLVIIDEDTYLASRWQGEIWLMKEGEATKLLDSKAEEIQTADIGYIPEEDLVLVPRFFSNKVTAYKLNY